ncbi:uncharacterized protein [Ptychodera flava]|uniref:uncharacterized protein isoform X3 n=1 Tax=Ptychodera flava TaxID=63121 RepID=UPI00396A5F96
MQEIFGGGTGSSDPFVRVAYRILRVLMYNLYYYPLFAAVTMESIVTFAIGTVYSFILLGLNIADVFSCNVNKELLINKSLVALPVLISLLYLAAILSYKFVKAIMKTVRTRKLEIKVQEQGFDVYQMRHLRMLLLSGRRLQQMSVVEDANESTGSLGRLKQILHRFTSLDRVLFILIASRQYILMIFEPTSFSTINVLDGKATQISIRLFFSSEIIPPRIALSMQNN